MNTELLFEEGEKVLDSLRVMIRNSDSAKELGMLYSAALPILDLMGFEIKTVDQEYTFLELRDSIEGAAGAKDVVIK